MISNKTLAILIVVTVLLSVSAQFISISRLGQIQTPSLPEPTGFASTGIGRVNLSILSNADIIIGHQQLDFGSGVINVTAGCLNATLSNNASDVAWSKCWANQSQIPNSPVANETNFWSIQNDGNINITLSLQSAQANWSNFIGNCTSSSEANWYRWAAFINSTETAATCQGMNSTAWANFTSASAVVCGSLNYADASDAIAVALNITICESNSPTGYKNDNVTFTASAA